MGLFWAEEVFSNMDGVKNNIGGVKIQSFFGVPMDNFQGDLTDILRGGGGSGGGGGVDGAQPSDRVCNWQQISFAPSGSSSSPDPLINNAERVCSSASRGRQQQQQQDLFGDPFCNMRDPLLHELNAAYFTSPVPPPPLPSSSSYPPPPPPHHHHHLMLNSPPPPPPPTTSFDDVDLDVDDARTNSTASAFCGGATSSTNTSNYNIFSHHQSAFGEEMQMSTPRRPGGIFSRIQISVSPNINQLRPNSPVMPAATPPPSLPSSSTLNSPRSFNSTAVTTTASKGCLVENNAGAVQIPSPRNLGIKRRKSQAKKVVCIPAPAASNSRPTGEVVPSDLWAWRKYGQKPIKGSPYPRGYYRCSSSKGCSARKQVERSRTDPNMLVITYTSEHNHPWPTQRNALAGSTRSTQHPTKTSNSGAASSKTNKTPNTNNSNSNGDSNNSNNPKEEQIRCNAAADAGAVKEEIIETDHEDQELDEEEPPETDKKDETSTSTTSTDHHHHHAQSYRPILMPPPPDHIQPSSSASDPDLFAELGEIDTTDPLHLLYDGGGGGSGGDDGEIMRHESKVFLDPFMSFFDWTTNLNTTNTPTTNSSNANSFGEAKERFITGP